MNNQCGFFYVQKVRALKIATGKFVVTGLVIRIILKSCKKYNEKGIFICFQLSN